MKIFFSTILLAVTIASVFKSATPFLSYKANYEFIFTEMCEMRGTSNHNDCDGFCYLRKQVHNHEEGAHSESESGRTAYSHLVSSIFGLVENNIQLRSPLRSPHSYRDRYRNELTFIYPSIPTPPPRA